MEIVIWIIIGTLVRALIGQPEGRIGAGAFFGFLFGPIGLLISSISPNKKPKCPFCGWEIVEGAIKCCGSKLNNSFNGGLNEIRIR